MPNNYVSKIQPSKKKIQHYPYEWWSRRLWQSDTSHPIWKRLYTGRDTSKRSVDICTLQRRYLGYLANGDKNNGITIISKTSKATGYPYISICGQHGHRRHEARVLLTRNQGSTLFIWYTKYLRYE